MPGDEKDKIILEIDKIKAIPDNDIKEDLLKMLEDAKQGSKYENNNFFKDKLLWIAREYQKQGIKQVEISTSDLCKKYDKSIDFLTQIHEIMPIIEEETGIKSAKLLDDKIFGLNIVTVDDHTKRGKLVNSHLHMDIEYLFEADENEELTIKEDENSGVKWIPIDEVENYTSEEKMKAIYRKLNEKLKVFGR